MQASMFSPDTMAVLLIASGLVPFIAFGGTVLFEFHGSLAALTLVDGSASGGWSKQSLLRGWRAYQLPINYRLVTH